MSRYSAVFRIKSDKGDDFLFHCDVKAFEPEIAIRDSRIKARESYPLKTKQLISLTLVGE